MTIKSQLFTCIFLGICLITLTASAKNLWSRSHKTVSRTEFDSTHPEDATAEVIIINSSDDNNGTPNLSHFEATYNPKSGFKLSNLTNDTCQGYKEYQSQLHEAHGHLLKILNSLDDTQGSQDQDEDFQNEALEDYETQIKSILEDVKGTELAVSEQEKHKCKNDDTLSKENINSSANRAIQLLQSKMKTIKKSQKLAKKSLKRPSEPEPEVMPSYYSYYD